MRASPACLPVPGGKRTRFTHHCNPRIDADALGISTVDGRTHRLDGAPVRAAHFLRAEAVPSNIFLEPMFTNPVQEVVSTNDAAAIRSAVLRGIEQPAPPGLVNGLSMMQWACVRANPRSRTPSSC